MSVTPLIWISGSGGASGAVNVAVAEAVLVEAVKVTTTETVLVPPAGAVTGNVSPVRAGLPFQTNVQGHPPPPLGNARTVRV